MVLNRISQEELLTVRNLTFSKKFRPHVVHEFDIELSNFPIGLVGSVSCQSIMNIMSTAPVSYCIPDPQMTPSRADSAIRPGATVSHTFNFEGASGARFKTMQGCCVATMFGAPTYTKDIRVFSTSLHRSSRKNDLLLVFP